MAQTTRLNNNPTPGETKAVGGLTAEARAKGVQVRKEMMPPEERRLTELSASLREQIKAEKDADTLKLLRGRLKESEAQRKTLAFVRRAALLHREVTDLAESIVNLANVTTYNASVNQRQKVKALFEDILARALAKFDDLPAAARADDEEDDKVAATHAAINQMAAMLDC